MTKAAHPSSIAVIGAGATTLYLLRQILAHADQLPIRHITVFERNDRPGVGMPYNPATTDRTNLCNISSVEIPQLHRRFAEWLRELEERRLADFGLSRSTVSASETYPRLLLGEYFQAQFDALVEQLREAEIEVTVRLGISVDDVRDVPDDRQVEVQADNDTSRFDAVVVATGHTFADGDEPAAGYYASPWPIQKLIPPDGEKLNFTIGTLGASLSAFDVVAALADRHGRFEPAGGQALRFVADDAAPEFRLVMHTAEGWLPHLQYEQAEPMRELYRHVDRATLMDLRTDAGLLRLETYFDKVCRPVLAEALLHDGDAEAAEKLVDGSWALADFVHAMERDHTYDDAFAGMRHELPEARESVEQDKPIHWKEVLDDLMYTLNYHAELMPAEDHETLRKLVMPFLMNVIAALPLRSARMLLALHDAGRLELVTGRVQVVDKSADRTVIEVDDDGKKSTQTYRRFVDCGGQPPVEVDDYPFQQLVADGTVRVGHVPSLNGTMATLAGIDVDRAYRAIGTDGAPNPRVIDISFAHAAGLRPYSYGLQACNETARLAVAGWLND